MSERLAMGILGCGDFLRWMANDIAQSRRVGVAALFDPRRAAAEKYAAKLGGGVAESAEAVLEDPKIGIVALFVPPWIRADLFARAARAGKHVLTTKPLASTTRDAEAIRSAADAAGIRAGVLYSRTGDPFIATAKTVLEDGRFGRLALYRQDWIHAYP